MPCLLVLLLFLKVKKQGRDNHRVLNSSTMDGSRRILQERIADSEPQEMSCFLLTDRYS
jgi:hypothetical protein